MYIQNNNEITSLDELLQFVPLGVRVSARPSREEARLGERESARGDL